MDRIGHLLKIAAEAVLCQGTLPVADKWPTMREGKWQILESRGEEYFQTQTDNETAGVTQCLRVEGNDPAPAIRTRPSVGKRGGLHELRPMAPPP